MPDDLDLSVAAPDSFLVQFVTTKGAFVVKARRAWAPHGVDRLYHLAQSGYYNGVVIYRIGETMSAPGGLVAQFGSTNDAAVNAAWDEAVIPDEPVIRSNTRGTVIFARGGPETRSASLALNLTDNPALDTVSYGGVVGFPPVAEAVEGIDVWDVFNDEHGNAPAMRQDSIAVGGRAYLDRVFPGLDRIERVSVLEEW